MILTGQKKIFAEITTPDQVLEYDLDLDREFSVQGISGHTDIVIRNKEIFITNSPCENKTCIHQGKISKAGQWLCCAPNQVIIIIKGTDDKNDDQDLTDAISF